MFLVPLCLGRTLINVRYELDAILLASLAWYAEAGAIYQDISGTEQWTGTARTGLTWTQGKLSLRAGYDFNDQHTGSGQFAQEFIRHHFYFYMRRTF